MATDVSSTSVSGSDPGIDGRVRRRQSHSRSRASRPRSRRGRQSAVTVTAYDAYGNVATGYTGSVALASSDGRAVLPAELRFSSTRRGHAKRFGHARHRRDAVHHREGRAQFRIQRHRAGHHRRTPPRRAFWSCQAIHRPWRARREFTVTARDPYGNAGRGYTARSASRAATRRRAAWRVSLRLHVHDRPRRR